VLKPGDTLILSVPIPYCWVEVYGNLRRLPESEGHICSFTHQTLSRLLAFNNMAIVDRCGTYFRVPLLPRWTEKPPVVKTDRLFLTRSYIYKIVPLL